MPAKYVSIPLDEIRSFLADQSALHDLTEAPNEPTRDSEYAFNFVSKNGSGPKLGMRVYTSVSSRASEARGCGQDAIRVVIYDARTGKGLRKFPHVKRVENWRRNLASRIEDAVRILRSTKPCVKTGCDGVLFLRQRKSDKAEFYGCSNYPSCGTGSSVERKSSTYIEAVKEDGDCERRVRTDEAKTENLIRGTEAMGCRDPGAPWSVQHTDGWCALLDQNVESPEIVAETLNVQTLCRHFVVLPYGVERRLPTCPGCLASLSPDSLPCSIVQDDVVPLGMDHAVPCVRASEWKYGQFPFRHFNPMQSDVVRTLFSYDCDFRKIPNLIVTSPTASGKTVVIEMLMSMAMAQGKKAVYLAPMRAIVQEKWDDWSNPRAGSVFEGKKGEITTGDYVMDEERMRKLQEADWICATSEMIDSKTRSRQSWLKDVGVLVVDEGHLLGMEERGDKLETALMRFSYLVPGAAICLLSATMSNTKQLSDWLTSLNRLDTLIVESDYRPCKLHRRMIPIDVRHLRYSEAEDLRLDVTVSTMREILAGDPKAQILVFTGNKTWGRDATDQIRATFHAACEFHSADLERDERIELMHKFIGGDLQFIVATTTFAWGVNLPARHVIIPHQSFGLTPMCSIDVNQMIGRAGRPKFDTEGFAHLLVPSHEMKLWEEQLGGPQMIRSKLDTNLLFHVVGEVATGVIQDAATLRDWYSRSLGKVQAMGSDPVGLEDSARVLHELYSWEMLEPVTPTPIQVPDDTLNVRWRCTKLGRVAAHLYFHPADVYAWKRNFDALLSNTACLSMKSIQADASVSEALARIYTISQGYLSRAEQNSAQEYARVHHSAESRDPWVKHAAAYWFRLRGRDVPPVLNPCVRALVGDLDRVMEALAKIDSICGWSRSAWLADLRLRFRYGVPEELVPLVRIPGIGSKYARQLYDAGFETAEMVADPSNSRQLRAVLGSKAEAISKAAKEVS
jgi:helicase